MAKKGRSTVYNEITSEEKLKQVNPENKQLEEDFLKYLSSTDKSKLTIKQYTANLHILWCYGYENIKDRKTREDKCFVDYSKRDIMNFQNHALNVWKWSPKRLRTVKATYRSLENFIIKMLDDEYPDYRRIWTEIESPANEPVREKTVLTKEDVQELLNKLVERKQYEKACAVALAIYSGKRKAELTRFKVSYFGEDNLICGGALYKTPEKIKSKGRGTKGKLIYAYTLAKPFQPYLDLWLNQRKELGVESDWLFPKYENGKWLDEHIETTTIDSWARSLSTISGKAIYFHSFRHFYTSYLLDQNLPENVVQSLSSWSSRDMVAIYDDRPEESQFEKFFGAEGIKQVEQKGLEDL